MTAATTWLATYSTSAAAPLDRFKAGVFARLAFAAFILASAAAKRSLTDMVRGWGSPNCQNMHTLKQGTSYFFRATLICSSIFEKKSERSFLESL